MCRVFSYNIPTEFSLPGFRMSFKNRKRGRMDGPGGGAVPSCRPYRPGCWFRPVGAGVIGALAVLALAGCSERVLETGPTYGYFVGEVFGVDEPEAPPTPRLVRRMSGTNPDYPTLYTVPMRPPAPPTLAERQAALDKLAADRRAGHLADEVLKEVAPPPLPVPPAPDGVAGAKGAAPAASGPAGAPGH